MSQKIHLAQFCEPWFNVLMQIQEQDSAKLAYLAITAQSDGKKDLPVISPEATNHRDETTEKTSAEAYQIRLARIAEAQKQIDAISDPDLKKKAQEVLDSAISSGGSIADAKKEIAGNRGTADSAGSCGRIGKSGSFCGIHSCCDTQRACSAQ